MASTCKKCGRIFLNCCDDNEYCTDCLQQMVQARLAAKGLNQAARKDESERTAD